MKQVVKLLTVLTWFLFVNSSETTEWYVVYYSDESTIHKCPRDKFLEYKELLQYTPPDERLDLAMYYAWEPDYQIAFINLN